MIQHTDRATPSLKTFNRILVFFALVNLAGLSVSAKKPSSDIDKPLRKTLKKAGVEAVEIVEPTSDAMFLLGQALFFDRVLSGNRDTSCATCHHPLLGTGDGLALPVGTGTDTPGSLGLARVKGQHREFIPRNAPEVFHRGHADWTTQFWDGRVAQDIYGDFDSPAGEDLPAGILDNVLAVQAMFPVTSRDEMRGAVTDVAEGNEIAAIPDDDLPAIWEALMQRLRAIKRYRELFIDAYGFSANELGFDSVAKAISVFEATAFSFDDSPFDEYLRGDNAALSPEQKRGAILFYGKANCSSCHSGTLMTDQKNYNLGIPQLGPGKDPASGLDPGRFLESGDSDDLFRFRTPPLRNVAATGPWMHNGAFANLRNAVLHHVNPRVSASLYNAEEQLDQPELVDTVDAQAAIELGTLDIARGTLSLRELNDLLAFLKSLTAPELDARLEALIPASVPSKLPVEPAGK